MFMSNSWCIFLPERAQRDDGTCKPGHQNGEQIIRKTNYVMELQKIIEENWMNWDSMLKQKSKGTKSLIGNLIDHFKSLALPRVT